MCREFVVGETRHSQQKEIDVFVKTADLPYPMLKQSTDCILNHLSWKHFLAYTCPRRVNVRRSAKFSILGRRTHFRRTLIFHRHGDVYFLSVKRSCLTRVC